MSYMQTDATAIARRDRWVGAGTLMAPIVRAKTMTKQTAMFVLMRNCARRSVPEEDGGEVKHTIAMLNNGRRIDYLLQVWRRPFNVVACA
jgi:hypothetical protein